MQRVGVIGLGKMGSIHLRNYCEMADVTVAGVYDAHRPALDAAAERFGVPAFAELETLLAQGLDAVSVCVPTALHREVGLKVIASGASLLIEKPLAATAAEGRELVEAARAKGVTLMVGHVERFNPAVRKVKELVCPADVVSIHIERVSPYPARIQDVGVIRDLGPHDIDIARHLACSDFVQVHGVFTATRGVHEDMALITGRLKSGALVSISTNWSTPFRARTLRVTCKDKCICADMMTQQVREYCSDDPTGQTYTVREVPTLARETIKEELTAFLAALRAGTPAPITGEDGLKVLEVIERVFACGA